MLRPRGPPPMNLPRPQALAGLMGARSTFSYINRRTQSPIMAVSGMKVYPVSLRFKEGFSISRGRIGDVGALAPHVLVKVMDEDEGTGWGESRSSHLWSYETNETVVSTLRGYLRDCIEGHDPRDFRSLHARMDAIIAPGIARGQPIAKSSIDMACHDLVCRSEGISLSEHFGGSGEAEMQLSYLVSASSPEEAADAVCRARERGYLGFKIKIGKGVESDLEIIAACREAAGNLFLWADANQAYGYDDALRLAKGASASDLQILEQPLPATDRHGLVRLDRSSPVKIAVDESVFTAADLRDFLSLGFRGAVVIKTAKSGGLLPASEMIEMAKGAGLEVLGSGLTEGMVGFSASLQLFSACGISRPVDLNGPQFIEDHVSSGATLEEGVARARGPGLGITVNEALLEG
jgi:L-alanine-DL-glutamate epimerase-like enolase superfamily enzyme